MHQPRPQTPTGVSVPGLKWRQRKNSWVAHWGARDDAAKRQFPIKSRHLWPPSEGGAGAEPSAEEWQAMSITCEDLQDEMLTWLRGGAAASGDPASMFDDTVTSLIRIYETDPDSPYKELRFHTAKTVLDAMEFENPKKRKTFVTAPQAVAIRAEAHRRGRPSIALAQALEFELGCRQKDAIWEWLPQSEPGLSEITAGGDKAMHGFHWNNVTPDLWLSHRLSKSLRGRRATVSTESGHQKRWHLVLYPMVMEELALIPPELRVGAMVKAEHTGLPWRHKYFQQHWREIATAVGVPANVQNRDSRAGAATEGENAGADIETIRHGLGHSKPETTRIYTRTADEQTAKLATIRSASRNKPGTK